MSIRPRVAASVCVWALVALAYACSAQPPAGDAQKQIDDLRAQVAGMQKDIDAIKSAVADLRASRAPTGPVLELGDRPIKGSPTARLTLVEVTDYQ